MVRRIKVSGTNILFETLDNDANDDAPAADIEKGGIVSILKSSLSSGGSNRSNSNQSASPSTEKLRSEIAKSKSENSNEYKVFLRFEIEDEGIFLSDEDRRRIFNPFSSSRSVGQKENVGGNGLGLFSLMKRIDALGGYSGVSSRRDLQRGSLFWFCIPYVPADGKKSKSSGAPVSGSSSSLSFNKEIRITPDKNRVKISYKLMILDR
jgi:hypothetical protein